MTSTVFRSVIESGTSTIFVAIERGIPNPYPLHPTRSLTRLARSAAPNTHLNTPAILEPEAALATLIYA
jgi:hypothetical protein